MNVASRTLDEVPARSRVPLETIASGVGLLITRAQADEAVLTQSAIVSTMAEGVCLVRVSDDTIVYANPRFERMFGYGPGEMNGLPVARVNFAARDRSDEQVARDIIARLARTGEAEYEVCNVRKDGTPFWCLAHATTLDHPALGKVWVAVHEDITERKRAEAALEQKNAALRELLEQMAAEKGRIHETIVAKIEDAVLPLLPKLRLRGASRKYLDLLKHHLRDISGTYTGDARRRQPCRLTPRETEIGEMIRARLSSKDIAAMLGLSVQTVQRHRRNIRRRLGLRGKKQNLTSFLAIR
jgi:PAS domain S-box-containing protein